MTHMFSKSLTAVALAGVLLTGSACSDDDDPTAPTVAQVAGSYAATRLNATTPLGTQNLLDNGGSLTMELLPSRVLTGEVSIPTQGIVDLAFTGTWRIDGTEVDVDQADADTFVEDLSFKVVGNTLVADEIIDIARVRVTLAKQP